MTYPTKKGLRIIERMLRVDKRSEQAQSWPRRELSTTRAERAIAHYVFGWLADQLVSYGFPPCDPGPCPSELRPYSETEVTLLTDPLPSEGEDPNVPSNSS